jgi:hypothetical protein
MHSLHSRSGHSPTSKANEPLFTLYILSIVANCREGLLATEKGHSISELWDSFRTWEYTGDTLINISKFIITITIIIHLCNYAHMICHSMRQPITFL